MIVTADNHIYRRTKGGGENYLGCYFNTITKAILKKRPEAQRCKGNAVNCVFLASQPAIVEQFDILSNLSP